MHHYHPDFDGPPHDDVDLQAEEMSHAQRQYQDYCTEQEHIDEPPPAGSAMRGAAAAIGLRADDLATLRRRYGSGRIALYSGSSIISLKLGARTEIPLAAKRFGRSRRQESELRGVVDLARGIFTDMAGRAERIGHPIITMEMAA